MLWWPAWLLCHHHSLVVATIGFVVSKISQPHIHHDCAHTTACTFQLANAWSATYTVEIHECRHASTPPKQSPSLRAQTNIQARKLMLARMHPDRQPRTHTHKHKHPNTYTHPPTHPLTHTHTHTHAHAHAHARTHTHTQTCAISDRSLQVSVQNDTFIRAHNTCIHT